MTNTILFAGGEDSEFTLFNASMVTTPGKFRSTYARAAISCGAMNTPGAQHLFAGDLAAYLAGQPANDKEFWYGYRWVGGGGFIIGGISLRMYDSAGTGAKEWFRLRGQGAGDQQLQLSPDGFTNRLTLVNYPASTIAQPGTPAEWCFRIKIHPTAGVIEWWINGGLWYSTPVGNTAAYCSGSPSKAIFGCANSNGDTYISEVRATAASRPCVGMDIFTADYTADGANTAWAGGVASINEIREDSSTLLTSTAAGQDSCFVSRPLPALSGNMGVQAVINSGKWRTTVGAPQHLKHYLRIGGTNYLGASQSVPTVAGTLQTVWETSPATGVPFTASEFNNAQKGMESAA